MSKATSEASRRSAPLTELEIDLDAVARNWLFLKKNLASGCDCGAVVKADAYGLGAVPVSRALFMQGCRHFFVATAEEGASVRAALPSPDAVIYVLDGPWGATSGDFLAQSLVPVLNSADDLVFWQEEAVSHGKKLPAVLHFDTGMNRLGLPPALATADMEAFRVLDVRCVMSHLACADDPAHPKNAEQKDLFETLTQRLSRPLRRSLANSAGVLLGSGYHFDLARPGCGLYGISPLSTEKNPMQPVVTLRARILQVRDVVPPATIGYGAAHTVVSPAKCATIALGYADGYLRSLSARGHVFIGDTKCPVLGRVSMDSIVVDATETAECGAGDWAFVLDARTTADDAAKAAGTIGYEILTSLGKRHKRIYAGG